MLVLKVVDFAQCRKLEVVVGYVQQEWNGLSKKCYFSVYDDLNECLKEAYTTSSLRVCLL